MDFNHDTDQGDSNTEMNFIFENFVDVKTHKLNKRNGGTEGCSSKACNNGMCSMV